MTTSGMVAQATANGMLFAIPTFAKQSSSP